MVFPNLPKFFKLSKLLKFPNLSSLLFHLSQSSHHSHNSHHSPSQPITQKKDDIFRYRLDCLSALSCFRGLPALRLSFLFCRRRGAFSRELAHLWCPHPLYAPRALSKQTMKGRQGRPSLYYLCQGNCVQAPTPCHK